VTWAVNVSMEKRVISENAKGLLKALNMSTDEYYKIFVDITNNTHALKAIINKEYEYRQKTDSSGELFLIKFGQSVAKFHSDTIHLDVKKEIIAYCNEKLSLVNNPKKEAFYKDTTFQWVVGSILAIILTVITILYS